MLTNPPSRTKVDIYESTQMSVEGHYWLKACLPRVETLASHAHFTA